MELTKEGVCIMIMNTKCRSEESISISEYGATNTKTEIMNLNMVPTLRPEFGDKVCVLRRMVRETGAIESV
jgi:hypothetical protein